MLRDKSILMVPGIVVVAMIIVIVIVLSRATTSDSRIIPMEGDYATRAARQGHLTISVMESGTIQAREKVIIKNEVEGHTSILWLIDEGKRVKKGELLVELDASSKIDQKINFEMQVENAEANQVQARENLAVVGNQTESDLAVAELNLAFAKQDLEKYLEGEYPNQLKAAQSNITLAREELLRSEEKLEWSKRLYEENYLSHTELQQDELAASRDKLDLEQAENNLNLLVNYTHKRNTDQFQSNVEQAEMALDRVRRKARADVLKAEATLRAREAEYQSHIDKLKRLEEQIEKTKVYAPSDGRVIYATSGGGKHRHWGQEPLAEGSNVRERQELIHLPTTTSVKAEISIHEANLEKVETGMPVRVTMDALPGQVFNGHVANIAPLPDPQSSWMNPDLKVYNSDVYIETNGQELRTGTSCKAEIIIEELEDAVFVPVQSVIRVKGEPTVYVARGSNMEQRTVEIGLDDNRMVHIRTGLEEGEAVLLAPPLASGEIDTAATRGPAKPASSGKAKTASLEPHPSRGDRKAGKAGEGSGSPGGEMRGRRGGPPGSENLTQEQREEFRKQREQYEKASPEEQEKMRQQWQKRRAAQLESMSPEQREELRRQAEERRKQFENMSPEEREKLRQQFRGRG